MHVKATKVGKTDCVRPSHVDPNEGWGQQERDYGDELPAARPERAGFFSVSLVWVDDDH